MKQTNWIFAGIMGLSLASSMTQAADTLTAGQKEAVKAVVKEMLQENPELVIEAIQSWRDKQTAIEAEQRKQAIAALNKEAGNTSSPFWGHADGKTIVVEFSDYNCPYCKRAYHGIRDLVNSDSDIKIVMKELPVLGPASEYAAKAALAANMQGKYDEFHAGMMEMSSRVSVDGVLAVAKKIGVNVDQLKKEMDSPAVTAELAKNREWAKQLNISGTPAFVVGESMVPGAIDKNRLAALVKQARE